MQATPPGHSSLEGVIVPIDGSDALFAKAASRQHESPNHRRRRLRVELVFYFGYLLFHIVGSPIFAIRSALRARKRGHRGIVWLRLLGGTKPPSQKRWTILYAGGLGEKRAAFAFAEKVLSERQDDIAVCVQAQNAVGIEHAQIHSGVLPFNNPISVLIFLWRWRPKSIIGVEFWDNHHLSAMCLLFGIRTTIFNVPITELATRQITKQARWRYRLIGAYCVQGKIHYRRLVHAGVDPESIVVTGPIGIKVNPVQGLDATPLQVANRYAEELHLSSDCYPVIVAGSTYRADESAILDAFDAVKREFPKAVLILAPRGVKRPGGCDSSLIDRNLEFVRRSVPFEALPESGIILIDQVGELKYLYSVGHIAYVGGTMGTQGTGHTPVEAMAWGLPITSGPDFPQQKLIFDMLLKEGIATVCKDGSELAKSWLNLAKDAGLRQKIAESTSRVLGDSDTMILRIYDELCV